MAGEFGPRQMPFLLLIQFPTTASVSTALRRDKSPESPTGEDGEIGSAPAFTSLPQTPPLDPVRIAECAPQPSPGLREGRGSEPRLRDKLLLSRLRDEAKPGRHAASGGPTEISELGSEFGKIGKFLLLLPVASALRG